jgi:hypothetical protein
MTAVVALGAVVMTTGAVGEASPASSTGYRLIATLTGPQVPTPGVWMFDLGWSSRQGDRYYLSDISNKRVDIFDTRNHRLIGSVPGFTGGVPGPPTPANLRHVGPTGLVTIGDELWAGNGDSTVKVIDLTTRTIVASIATGGGDRADELAYDPSDKLVLIGNSSDQPPFGTFISTTSRRAVAHVSLPGASGIEQPIWDAAQHRFFVTIPSTTAHPGGEIIGLSPISHKIVKTYKLASCGANGLALGPHDEAVVGCDHAAAIVSLRTGHTLARLPRIQATDVVAYDSNNHTYFLAAGAGSANAALGVVDALTRRQTGSLPTSVSSHVVSVDSNTNRVYVPSARGVLVFAPL